MKSAIRDGRRTHPNSFRQATMFLKGSKSGGKKTKPNIPEVPPIPSPASPPASRRDTPPPAAARSETPPGAGTPSIISADLKIVGNLNSNGDLQIDGRVEGDIASRRLTIGQGAVVHGAVVAESVRVYGRIHGEIRADSVMLAKTAEVEGDIAHRTLSMEAGASVAGRLTRLETPTGDTRERARPAAGESASAPHTGGSSST
ncbi:MAG: polymer-forming cytoskeletal protein [Alphaproteobacteria bacterium]|nr:MAG: polymer-forming cytoskeletal protein [Alphaproteobacteria bacterium]